MRPLETKSIYDLIKTHDFSHVRDAMVSSLEELIHGVTIVSHPGKLDISDVVAADMKTLPAIMIGWTRQKNSPQLAQHYGIDVEFTAYIAVNDMVNIGEKRAIKREDVANGIGAFLLKILNHDGHNTFGIAGLTPPLNAKPPEFKPVFTSKSYAKGVAYYAVVWTQTIVDQGKSIATDPSTQITISDGIMNLSENSDPENDVIEALFKINEEAEE